MVFLGRALSPASSFQKSCLILCEEFLGFLARFNCIHRRSKVLGHPRCYNQHLRTRVPNDGLFEGSLRSLPSRVLQRCIPRILSRSIDSSRYVVSRLSIIVQYYQVLESIANLFAECYKVLQSIYRVLQSTAKYLQSIGKYYKEFAEYRKVLQSIYRKSQRIATYLQSIVKYCKVFTEYRKVLQSIYRPS